MFKNFIHFIGWWLCRSHSATLPEWLEQPLSHSARVAASATLAEWLSGWVAGVKISAIARSIERIAQLSKATTNNWDCWDHSTSEWKSFQHYDFSDYIALVWCYQYLAPQFLPGECRISVALFFSSVAPAPNKTAVTMAIILIWYNQRQNSRHLLLWIQLFPAMRRSKFRRCHSKQKQVWSNMCVHWIKQVRFTWQSVREEHVGVWTEMDSSALAPTVLQNWSQQTDAAIPCRPCTQHSCPSAVPKHHTAPRI